MPTPFQHLCYAKRLLDAPALPKPLHNTLELTAGAYFLGSTAGDIQAITGQPRLSTHFYRVWEPNGARAAEKMMAANPELADPYTLSAEHAAFISGYLVHLSWDEIWLAEVFAPFYMEARWWPDRLTRSVHHNALRAGLDQEAYRTTQNYPQITQQMAQLWPAHWLPFAPDSAICQWRDWLVLQLKDPAKVETLKIFAERMGVSVAELEGVMHAILEDSYDPPVPGLMAAIARFEQRALVDSHNILLWYWKLRDKIKDSDTKTHGTKRAASSKDRATPPTHAPIQKRVHKSVTL